MAGNDWTLLELLEMAEKSWNGWKWLTTAGNGWKGEQDNAELGADSFEQMNYVSRDKSYLPLL